jgi:RNA polymerase sigma factor (sigma-70 family)
MTHRRIRLALQNIRALGSVQRSEPLSDHELLQKFVRGQDEAAFATLLRRHGPMVLRVCRRILHDWHLAEDAFQATFLVLARRAEDIWPDRPLNCWLQGVARRVALRACRRGPVSNTLLPEVAARLEPAEDTTLRELRPILEEELQRLPERYRAPLLLCYLEGKTRDEAAQQLGWLLGSVKWRLERGRELLRGRLARRGLALSSFLLSALEAESAVVSVPAELLATTVQAALPFAADPNTAPAGISAAAVALAQGALTTMIASKLKIATALLLALTLLCTGTGVFLHLSAAEGQKPAAAPAPAEQVPVRKDIHGEPLPTGAVSRLGAMHWWHESRLAFVAYTPDGKYVITATYQGVIRKWEAASGKEVLQMARVPANAERGGADIRCRSALLSADGRRLAIITYGEAVNLYDVVNGRYLHRITPAGIVTGAAFSPDNKSLVTTAHPGREVIQWDATTGKQLRQFGGPLKGAKDYAGTHSPGISADGKVLAHGVSEYEGLQLKGVWVRRWGLATGKELSPAKQLPSAKGNCGVIIAGDGKSAACCDWKTGEVTLWDLEADKELRRLEGQSPFVVFSPDSKLVAGRKGQPFGLRGTTQMLSLWDVQTGKLLRQFEKGGGSIGIASTDHIFAFSADGKHLVAGVDDKVRQWDVGTGKESNPPSGDCGAVSALALARDGKTVFSWDEEVPGGGLSDGVAPAQEVPTTLRAWDTTSGRELRRTALPMTQHAVFAADGRTLVLGGAGPVRKTHRVHVWDAAEGKELRQWEVPSQPLMGLAVSPNGQTVAVLDGHRTIWLYDAATGKQLHQLVTPEVDAPPELLSFSADSRVLATCGRKAVSKNAVRLDMEVRVSIQWVTEIRLHDVKTGKVSRKFDDFKLNVHSLGFMPDGRTLVTMDHSRTLTLWETATGKARFRFQTDSQPNLNLNSTQAGKTLAFSPNGNVIITGEMNGVIRYWDPSSGKEMSRSVGHKASVSALVAAFDGKSLISGSQDTTALVWRMPQEKQRSPQARGLDSKQADQLWRDLGAEPTQAFQAIVMMRSFPRQAVPLLKERLKPAAPPDGKQVVRWIADLDSDKFAVRQTAETELEKLGDLAMPAFEQALAQNVPQDTRQRIERLRDRLVTATPGATVLQTLRALEALERIGTAEARQVLEKMAQGAAGALVTRQARASLRRLGQ